MPQRAFDRVRLAAAGAVAAHHLRQACLVGCADQPVEAGSLDLLGGVAQDALDRGALIGDDAAGIEHADQVAGMGDEGAEPCLALPPVQVERQRCALDREGDLGDERLERVDHLRLGPPLRADDEPAAELVTHHQGQHDHRVAVEQAQLPPHADRQVGKGFLNRSIARVAQPPARRARKAPGAVVLRGGCHRALSDHEANVGSRPEQALNGAHRRLVHLLVPRRCDEVDARAAQSGLAGGGLRLLPHKPRHATHHEEEERSGGRDQHEDVRIGEGVEQDRRGDQTATAEQEETCRRELGAGDRRRLLERSHRRVQRRQAPQHLVGHPTEVVAELMVVRLDEERVPVGGVDGEQGDDARHEHVERGSALARVDGEPDGRREQQDVTERIRRRHAFRHPREAGEVDVGGDQEHPREQADADREDRGVDHRRAVAHRVPPPHENRADPPSGTGRRPGRSRHPVTGTAPRPRPASGSCTCTGRRGSRGTSRARTATRPQPPSACGRRSRSRSPRATAGR